MTEQTIINKLFKTVIPEPKGKSTEETAAILFKHGIILSKPIRLTQKTIESLIDLYGVNLLQANSTFYKTVQERAKKESWEVMLDRIILYMTTYGGFNLFGNSEAYEPTPVNDELINLLKSNDFKPDTLTYLTVPKNPKDLEWELQSFLTIVTSMNTQDAINLLAFMDAKGLAFPDYTQLHNKEIKILLSTKYGIVPDTPSEFVRAFNYVITNSPLLINNLETTLAYNHVIDTILYNHFSKQPYTDLAIIATLFRNYYNEHHTFARLGDEYRHHKKFYLNLRRVAQTARYANPDSYASRRYFDDCVYIVKSINKIKRESDKHHTPQNIQNIFTDDIDVKKLAKDLSVASLIKLYNTTIAHINSATSSMHDGPRYNLYHVRNGKSYIKPSEPSTHSLSKLNAIKQILREELIRKTSKRFSNLQVLLTKGVHYAAPTSGKQFVQNLPFFSYIDLDELNADSKINVGISWNYNSDLDLHAQTQSGHVGYYCEDIDGVRHSGDMVSLNKYGYAAEYLTIDRNVLDEPMSVAISNYDKTRSVDGKTCKFIIANSQHKRDDKFIIAPEAIKFATTCNPTNVRNIDVGYLVDNKFIFTNLSFYGNVPNEDDMTVLCDIVNRKQEESLMLDELLELAGAEIIYDEKDIKNDFDNPDNGVLDLRIEYVSQSDLIDLVNFK